MGMRMIDQELIEDIRHTFLELTTLHELDPEEVESLAEKIANKFIIDRSKIWWWESLTSNSFVIEYGEEDGLKILENLISNDQPVFLFVTDDEPEPWNVFIGNFGCILDVLKNQRFFEYFIVSEEIEWVVFDTHHNSLFIAGTLLTKAKKVKDYFLQIIGNGPRFSG